MLHNDAVKRAFCRFNAAKCATHGAPRARHEMARAWRARGGSRRPETANRAFDRIVAQHFGNAAQ
eukprot:796488-Lingulodinium_polyedra.AAC.1